MTNNTQQQQQQQQPSTSVATPASFLQKIVGKAVIVKLTNGFEYHGKLATLDAYLNLVLEDAKEVVGRDRKDGANELGVTFLRGNNVYYVSEV
mmetsp:Transcript_7257/g.27176  ORF Transcript_7257/g.27176 Transcript_7257/m.27176 type:complete len:93 (-) Transcript_7257:503-781(-)|eukprot:CAMPEP_0117448694 /NCGR_PEP_ID=MMETSP0759-20121206/7541_1 /TAXON_ID=63605 /ORGANISM="Percolomonas cosmopolitus, Strain WS" /LENGTH=92 /DNA_ID=CAMNT_0005241105 /DNA_START=26 /DNA_END=304 /DNA_ORIENTATION=-